MGLQHPHRASSALPKYLEDPQVLAVHPQHCWQGALPPAFGTPNFAALHWRFMPWVGRSIRGCASAPSQISNPGMHGAIAVPLFFQLLPCFLCNQALSPGDGDRRGYLGRAQRAAEQAACSVVPRPRTSWWPALSQTPHLGWLRPSLAVAQEWKNIQPGLRRDHLALHTPKSPQGLKATRIPQTWTAQTGVPEVTNATGAGAQHHWHCSCSSADAFHSQPVASPDHLSCHLPTLLYQDLKLWEGGLEKTLQGASRE